MYYELEIYSVHPAMTNLQVLKFPLSTKTQSATRIVTASQPQFPHRILNYLAARPLSLSAMRRTTFDDDEVNRPLKFTIESDEEQDPKSSQRSFRRPIPDTHSPPSLIHIRIARWLLRAFPKVLLLLVCVTLITALLPGGWRVGLCAANLLPPPPLRRGENVTLIGHRGCEFPYPENSLHALKYAADLLRYVELDVSLSSDHEVVVIHDSTLDRTTNGSGAVCENSLDYIKSLAVSMPERDPRGQLAQAKHCTDKNSAGQSMPCTYRVPTLGEVFNTLPENTKFMIDVKACYTQDTQTESKPCSNCTILKEAVKKAMVDNFVKPEQLTFTSSEEASLHVFRVGMPPGSFFSLGFDKNYAHYKKTSFIDLLEKGNYSTASMNIALVSLRPDFVRLLQESHIPGTLKHRDAFAWTIRRDLDFRLARCAGVSKLIVAEPEKMLKRLAWDVGSLLAEAP